MYPARGVKAEPDVFTPAVTLPESALTLTLPPPTVRIAPGATVTVWPAWTLRVPLYVCRYPVPPSVREPAPDRTGRLAWVKSYPANRLTVQFWPALIKAPLLTVMAFPACN